VSIIKEAYHPKAYLSNIKNIKLGLRARTRILNALEANSSEARIIAKATGMRYGVVLHHLRLLESEGIIERKGKKPHTWTLTGLGQKRLVNLT
jgi:DNA-binding transcriptional ArsR family regulator